MTLFIVYILVALGFSFLCSIAESVLLSITPAYTLLLQKQGRRAGKLLYGLKEDVKKPLAAILTLNTIAHTIGAAGAGAQGAKVFGEVYLGLISAILTLLILIVSEIIPKTLGAHYWRGLAPVTGYVLKGLIVILYPFVWLSGKLTRGLTTGPVLTGFSRDEFSAMAEISAEEGQIAQQELDILKNLMELRALRVKAVMTPRTVVFSLSADMTVDEFFMSHHDKGFSRIPIYDSDSDNIIGFVLRSDLLLAKVRGNVANDMRTYRRDMSVVPDSTSLSRAFNRFMRQQAHIMLIVNEYGVPQGIVTLEDLLETLLGLEIVDEHDETEDMQKLARKRWRRKSLAIKHDKQSSGQ